MADIGGRLGMGWEWEVEYISRTSICSYGDSRAFWVFSPLVPKPFNFHMLEGISTLAISNAAEPNMDFISAAKEKYSAMLKYKILKYLQVS